MEPNSRDTEKGDDNSNSEHRDEDNSEELRQFSLVDPEHLSQQLVKANLDDDETEELLQQAVKLNAQLKKILQGRQAPPGGSATRSARPKKAGSSEQKLRRGGARNPSGSSALPPIESADRKSAKVRAKSGTRSATSATPGQRAASGVSRKGSSKRTVERPAWDDRFSYS